MPNKWCIYFIENCRQSVPCKDKLVVTVCKDSQMMGFLINTTIRLFVQRQPDLLACQVYVKASDHQCLDRNSFIDCSDLKEFDDDQLIAEREPLDKQTIEQIKRVVNNAKTIEPIYKKLIIGE